MASYRVLYTLIVFSVLVVPYFCLVSSWGEFCNFTAECDDHRLECVADEENVTRCVCDRFHEWQGRTNGCAQIYDIETILNMTVTSNDYEEKLKNSTILLFTGHKIAGVFVASVALLCPLVVIIHCLHMRRKDRALKRELKDIKERVDMRKRESSRKDHLYISLA